MDKTGAIEQLETGRQDLHPGHGLREDARGRRQLLAELMRIKGEGDYAAIKALVDKYGVHFDPKLRDQVVARYKKLNLPTYWAGVNAELTATPVPTASRPRSMTSVSARCRSVNISNTGDVRRQSATWRGTGAAMTLPAASHADTRPYLLERVDDAAVVQLYADGFDGAAAREKILIYHLYQAALAGRDIYLRPALRAQPRDARRARGDPHARRRHRRRRRSTEIQRYTKLFWINTGPHNNLTARKFVLKCTPAAFAAAAAAARTTARASRCGRRIARPTAGTPRAALLRSRRRSDRHEQDAGRRPRHPAGEREQPLCRRRRWRTWTASRSVSAELAAGEAATARWSRRSTGSAAATTSTSARSSSICEAAVPVCDRRRWRAALDALITFYETGETADRVAYDIAWVQDRDSPVDTINGFVEVYMDARGMKGAWEALVYYVNPREDRGHPQARRRGAVVRGPDAVGRRSTRSRACAACPPTPSTS